VFGTASEIVEQRRAVYQAPIELLSADPSAAMDVDILDHPVTRGHLAEVISGTAEYDHTALRLLSEVADEVTTAGGHVVRVAASRDASDVLAPALRRVAGELGRHGLDAAAPEVLSSTDSGFGAGRDRLLAGIDLAVRVTPALALDLLPHVALFALLRPDRVDRLGSASAREYPGLVLLPEPDSALEAAEAFVHEGAHQKFFDLAITRSVFGADQYSAPGFCPTWAPEPHMAWPLEQTFAAFHAYRCLATFMYALRDGSAATPGSGSLLPVAGDRAAEIGDWLLGHTAFLGPDGVRLVTGLIDGRQAEGDDDSIRTALPAPGNESEVNRDFVRYVGGRTLVARRGRPMQLLWLVGDMRSSNR
jgi:hypothetical protein